MSQPVKLSDNLVLDARLVGQLAKRSIAGQIEFWAGLGRSVEAVLRGSDLIALQKPTGTRSLSDAINRVGTAEGRRSLSDFLSSQAFPHYEASQEYPGMLVRTDKDGVRTVGRFVNRKFQKMRKTRKR